jgi:hypothetical protein
MSVHTSRPQEGGYFEKKFYDEICSFPSIKYKSGMDRKIHVIDLFIKSIFKIKEDSVHP